ncbi:hypothetical protein HK096_001343 [Nowakowskiella sp. JEL0078]|nr:hypothetical protein HK096_001343 [Nowakowskiella sp. JEL0078]
MIPRMPELKSLKIEFDNMEIDTTTIPYKDKIREKQRLSKLATITAEKALRNATGAEKPARFKKQNNETESWSHNKQLKERRTIRREKKVKKREAQLRNAQKESEDLNRNQEEKLREWEELKEEERLEKKRRKGGKEVISESEGDD